MSPKRIFRITSTGRKLALVTQSGKDKPAARKRGLGRTKKQNERIYPSLVDEIGRSLGEKIPPYDHLRRLTDQHIVAHSDVVADYVGKKADLVLRIGNMKDITVGDEIDQNAEKVQKGSGVYKCIAKIIFSGLKGQKITYCYFVRQTPVLVT